MNIEQSHHYRALLNTIDFFSQRLHVEQIVTYGYKIFEDLTLPERGAIYTINNDDDVYIPRVIFGYPGDIPNIKAEEAHHQFASKNGFLLDKIEVQERYFDRRFLEQYNVDIIVPLILDDGLYGFIIATENTTDKGIKNREFINRFCDLLNLALEKAVSYDLSLKMKKEIDKRIFNLDSYSQTMSILMTALDQKYIVNLCLDVVRELTASKVTSVMIERKKNQLVLAAYKDLVCNKECFVNMTIQDGAKAPKIIYNVEQDREDLEAIFVSCEPLDKLEASYVVFIQKERLIGCITLSEPMSGHTYDQQLLEQIRNLVSMMYIALDNANQFEMLKVERNKMSTQLNALNHLNRSIAIINGADSLEELCSHVVDTLQYGFGVEEGYIWIDAGESNHLKQIGMRHTNLSYDEMTWLRHQKNMYASFTAQSDLVTTHETSNCFVCIPILQRDYNETCMGYLVVDQTKEALDEGLCMILEALSNSISPIVKQFLEIETYQRTHIMKPEAFLETLFNKYADAQDFYEMPYYLYVRKTNQLGLFALYEHEELEEGDRLLIGPFELIFSNELLDLSDYDAIEADHFEGLQEHLKRLSMN